MYPGLVQVTEKDTVVFELWLLLQKIKSGVSNANIWFNCFLWLQYLTHYLMCEL
jgi:hypothetical protein